VELIINNAPCLSYGVPAAQMEEGVIYVVEHLTPGQQGKCSLRWRIGSDVYGPISGKDGKVEATRYGISTSYRSIRKVASLQVTL
jgi:hypothetical protein